MIVRAGDADLPGFEGLAETVENHTLKFGKLVQKKDPQMRQTDFARPNARTAAYQSGHGCTVVRASKGPVPHQTPALQVTGNGRNHRNL